jgi:hypothetical protein
VDGGSLCLDGGRGLVSTLAGELALESLIVPGESSLPGSRVLWQHDQLVQRAEDHHQANLFCVLFRS